MVTTDDIRAAMLAEACAYCGAPPGEWCRTSGGYRSAFLHAARWWAWKRGADDE